MSFAKQNNIPRNERDRALDDQRVMTIPQWAEVNGFSIWTAQRLIKAGKAPDRSHKFPTAGSASLSPITAFGSSRGSGREPVLRTVRLHAAGASAGRGGNRHAATQATQNNGKRRS